MFVANPNLYSEDIFNLILLEVLPIGRLFCCSILIMGLKTGLADACCRTVIDVSLPRAGIKQYLSNGYGFLYPFRSMFWCQ